MELENFKLLPPEVGESRYAYCVRLEELGHEEMFIRKALAHHLRVGIDEMSALLNEFEIARLRHITMLRHLAPGRTTFSLTTKLAKNLGISEELAAKWVARYQETGDVSYIGMERMTPRSDRSDRMG